MEQFSDRNEIIAEKEAVLKRESYDKMNDQSNQSVIQELNSEELLRGIILSEILGKPLSKRRRKR